MTKREALHIAKKLLKQQEPTKTNLTALDMLDKIEEEVCRKHWTKESCMEAFEEWRLKYGQPPTLDNLESEELPSGYIVQRLFGERATKVLQRCYPNRHAQIRCDSEFLALTNEQLLDFFREQIREIKPVDGNDYNQRRVAGSPVWQTAGRRIGCRSWGAFYRKVIGEEFVLDTRTECKILEVEVTSPLADTLNSILTSPKGE